MKNRTSILNLRIFSPEKNQSRTTNFVVKIITAAKNLEKNSLSIKEFFFASEKNLSLVVTFKFGISILRLESLLWKNLCPEFPGSFFRIDCRHES